MMSINVHSLNESRIKMNAAILLYQGESNYSNGKASPVYATYHDVRDGKICAGETLKKEMLLHTFRSLVKTSNVSSGILSENILAIGLDYTVWWQKAGQRTYFFNTRQNPEMAAIAPAPSLIFAVKNKRLSLFAVKGNRRPTGKTKLYNAPLMNVYGDGTLCQGSMPLPSSSSVASAPEWEKSFWQSAFTHPNMTRAVKYNGGLDKLSRDLAAGNFEKFPSEVLLPNKTYKTLHDLVTQLERQ